MLADSLSRLRHVGLHKDNDPKESGYEYRKSILTPTKTQFLALTMIKM